MASSSTQTKKLPLAGGWSETVLSKLPPNIVFEPVMNMEKRRIWENKVMFPYTIADYTCAFGGPLPDAKSRTPTIMKLFPVYEPCQTRAFMNTTHNFNFIKPPNKVFRSAPYYGNEGYLEWLDRVQVGYGDFWKDSGIYELIQLSRVGPQYQQEMIIATMHFFESSTNTFHFECGMMTPTLFDVSAITGLSPVGEVYDPAKTNPSIEFDYKEKTFQKYILENHRVGEEEVSDIEHIAFLTLWLSHYVLCSKSLQVAKKFIPMAIQLHLGRQFGLGRLILGCLYESMQSLSANLKKTGDGTCCLAAGPFWLLQLWLNATFETELKLFLPGDYEEEARKRQIEGTRLVRLTPLPLGFNYEQLFLKYFNIFLNLKTFKESYAPFIERKVGPSWFVLPFPPLPEFEEFALAQWSAYLDPTVISCRTGLTAKDYGLVGYFPNLVSRQFGLTQLIPKSFYAHEQDICLGCTGMTEGHFRSYLLSTEKHKYELVPFPYRNSISSFFTFGTCQRHKAKAASTSSQQSVSVPVKDVKKGSKRTSNSVAENPPKKLKKNIIDLTEIDKQNIDADLGRVIAKVLSQISSPSSVKDQDKKKRKKEKKPSEGDNKEPQNDVAPGTPVGAPDIVEGSTKSKDRKKKKKKLRKAHSSSTTTIPDESISGKQPGEPQGAVNTTQNPPPDKTFEQHNESSNSCMQPPPVKAPISTIPETLEEEQKQDTPVTEHEPKGTEHEERSTADSPPKGNPEGIHQDLPHLDLNDQLNEGSNKEDDVAVEYGPLEKDKAHLNLGKPDEPKPQNPAPEGHDDSSNQKSPSPKPTDINQYFESSNEDNISAQPGGSSIDPQSSTSKISAAAGIPESLLQGLNASTPEEALEKLLSSGSFNTSSEGISAPTQDEEAARLEQAHLEARFIEEFLQRDVLDIIDEDPRAFFSLKALLQQLQTERTKEATLFLVTQAEAHIDQFAKNQQLLINTQKSYQAQMHAHAAALADAAACNIEVSNMRSGVTTAYLKTAACEDNIARWKAEIRVLETKIAEEEQLQKHYFELASEVTPAQIEAKANEGLRLCNNAATLKATAQRIDKESNLLKIKLSQLKELYRAFQRTSLSNI
ncbi:serine/threonine-protein phosphatase 7 long form protein [Trifolium repens]|nr:serine/threonine-protein phosphatase 7 long form protein [Trifolium repens]